MVLGERLIIGLVIDTAFVILCMHLTGRWFGIDFGPLKSAVSKVMAFILISGILYLCLGVSAFFLNFLIWIIGLKIAFRLEWGELLIFVFTYSVKSTLARLILVMLIA